MPFLQDLIHKLEIGPWFRYVRISLGILAVLVVLVWYNSRSFHNMNAPEAMDAAQVARNLAQGKGYTTYFVRPLSVHFVEQRNLARMGGAVQPRKSDGTKDSSLQTDYAQLKGMHPDLANPPVYPVVLAGLMKVLPFKWATDITNPFWSRPSIRPTPEAPRQFWRYKPDFLIALFNDLLFIAVIVLTFFLTRRLFDPSVAWMSAALVFGCELLWRFSVSGLSTMLLMLIFMGLIWCVVLLEAEVREPKGEGRVLLFAAATGLLVGLGALTRYSFGWIIIPLVVFFAVFGGARRLVICLATMGAFVLVLAPWIYRNWSISGTPFGTASFAILEGTGLFPGNRLERSLSPEFSRVGIGLFTQKLLINSRQILQNDIPKLAGSWTTLFFLVGLLLAFRNPAIRRLRYFIVSVLGTFIIVQALGRTNLSDETPEINSENLLVLIAPMVIVYGVSLFYLLLDQMNFPFKEVRYGVIGLFGFVMCLPMIFNFLPPRPIPIAYPPYYPPVIQQLSGWMKENELMMTDLPWAVAWYGQRQCIWLTLNCTSDPNNPDSKETFFAVNDYKKQIRALYLTPETMDSRFLSEWVRPGEHSWGSFILEFLSRREIPSSFPLRHTARGFLPEQLFVADWPRWKVEPDRTAPEAPP